MLLYRLSWKRHEAKFLIFVASVFCLILTKSTAGSDDDDEEEDNDKSKVNCTKNAWGYTVCECATDPITARYIDPGDDACEFYYLCHLGKAIKRKCRSGDAFHPQLRECLPRGRVSDKICKPLVQCPSQKIKYVEDRRDCTKYFLCSFGIFTHWSCPERRYFDPKGEECVKDKQHAEACTVMARRNFYKRAGIEEPPPKTSVALDQAKKYMEGRKGTKNPRHG